MATIIIDSRTKAAKDFIQYVKNLPFAKVIDEKSDEVATEKRLNPSFMKELEKSYKSKGVKIKTEDLWK